MSKDPSNKSRYHKTSHNLKESILENGILLSTKINNKSKISTEQNQENKQ